MKSGFALWMERVLEECDKAAEDFAPDPVHDLRVAIRRCRSLADGWKLLDPAGQWKQMKREGGVLFRSLGDLRDLQVMEEWVVKLSPAGDAVRQILESHLREQQSEKKDEAAETLRKFDRKSWKKWASELPRRAARLRPGSPVFYHLALERWSEAYALHKTAVRNRSAVSFHNLRIGIKRLRYIVENFVPELHHKWKGQLKELQDILGEVHDLDVLWARAQRLNCFPDDAARSLWRDRISVEREKRIARYRRLMVGQQSHWREWRKQLPEDSTIKAGAVLRLRTQASFLDCDSRHSQRVVRFSKQILSALPSSAPHMGGDKSRVVLLEAAAWLHAIRVRAKEQPKKSSKSIRKMAPPFGLSEEEMNEITAIVRYAGKKLPVTGDKRLAALKADSRRKVERLAGVLRLAEALDYDRSGQVTSIRVVAAADAIEIFATGFLARSHVAQEAALARYLLETICRRPVMIKPERARRLTLRRRAAQRSSQ